MATSRRAGKRPAAQDDGGDEATEQLHKQRKRSKAPTARQSATRGKPRISSRPQTANAPTLAAAKCHFLQLPAELRNRIYEYCALSDGARLRPRYRGRLISTSALCRVSKQVQDEWCDVLYKKAPVITAYVRDFNFSHIVTFLNKLSDREPSTLPTLGSPPGAARILEVHIWITQTCPENPEALQTWLRRCLHPTKKGTRIDVQYTVTTEPSRDICNRADTTTAMSVRRRLEGKLSGMESGAGGRLLRSEGGEEEDRLCVEMRKISQAVARACRVWQP